MPSSPKGSENVESQNLELSESGFSEEDASSEVISEGREKQKSPEQVVQIESEAEYSDLSPEGTVGVTQSLKCTGDDVSQKDPKADNADRNLKKVEGVVFEKNSKPVGVTKVKCSQAEIKGQETGDDIVSRLKHSGDDASNDLKSEEAVVVEKMCKPVDEPDEKCSRTENQGRETVEDAVSHLKRSGDDSSNELKSEGTVVIEEMCKPVDESEEKCSQSGSQVTGDDASALECSKNDAPKEDPESDKAAVVVEKTSVPLDESEENGSQRKIQAQGTGDECDIPYFTVSSKSEKVPLRTMSWSDALKFPLEDKGGSSDFRLKAAGFEDEFKALESRLSDKFADTCGIPFVESTPVVEKPDVYNPITPEVMQSILLYDPLARKPNIEKRREAVTTSGEVLASCGESKAVASSEIEVLSSKSESLLECKSKSSEACKMPDVDELTRRSSKKSSKTGKKTLPGNGEEPIAVENGVKSSQDLLYTTLSKLTKNLRNVMSKEEEELMYSGKGEMRVLEVYANQANRTSKKIEPSSAVEEIEMFRISVNVHLFDLESISCRLVGNTIDVYAVQRRQNDYGYENHEMHQIFKVPPRVCKDKFIAYMSNSFLFIEAPLSPEKSGDKDLPDSSFRFMYPPC